MTKEFIARFNTDPRWELYAVYTEAESFHLLERECAGSVFAFRVATRAHGPTDIGLALVPPRVATWAREILQSERRGYRQGV